MLMRLLCRTIGVKPPAWEMTHSPEASVAFDLAVQAKLAAACELDERSIRREEEVERARELQAIRWERRADKAIRRLPGKLYRAMRRDEFYVRIYVDSDTILQGNHIQQGTFAAYLADRLRAGGFNVMPGEHRRKDCLTVCLPDTHSSRMQEAMARLQTFDHA